MTDEPTAGSRIEFDADESQRAASRSDSRVSGSPLLLRMMVFTALRA